MTFGPPLFFFFLKVHKVAVESVGVSLSLTKTLIEVSTQLYLFFLP